MVSRRKSELPSLIEMLEAALNSVGQWFASRQMKVNAQLILFGTSQILRGVPPVQIHYGVEIITETQKVRNLGVDRHGTRHLPAFRLKNGVIGQ